MGWISKLFSKKPKAPVTERQPAPCGNDDLHYHWTEDVGWSCPKCMAIKYRKMRMADEDRMAKKIAAEVAALLNAGGAKQ